MTRRTKILGIIGLSILAAFLLYILIMNILYFRVPRPAIRKGEFPFRLEYSINGEVFVVEDTVVCRYNGVRLDAGLGLHRTWRSYLLSNGEKVEGVFIFAYDDIRIYASVGSAAYYMDDERYTSMPRPWIPQLYGVTEYTSVWPPLRHSFSLDGILIPRRATEMLEKYEIELISWAFSEPIENSFR
jgi:hypothetical protein